MFIDFAQQTLWLNVAVFALAAVAVWMVGARLTTYAELIAERTGLGKALIGVVLLGTATSLPEIATTVTASATGNAALAGGNLLGGVAIQTAVLAIVDGVALRRRALTFFAPQSLLMMQGVVVILLILVAIAAIAVGSLATIFHVGMWSILLLLLYLLGLYIFHRYEGNPRWEAAGEMTQTPESAADLKDAHQERYAQVSTRQIWLYILMAAVGVLICGYLVVRTGEALAEQTGLGSSFVGATLVAAATSLPEISTTLTAVRFGAYSMAIANIFGTNALEIALFLPADLLYSPGPIFAELDTSAIFLGALGAIMTAIYLLGLLERRDKTILGLGYDSAAAVVFYIGGMVIFYFVG